MWDRTVTVHSAGSKRKRFFYELQPSYPIFSEAFAATGWRVGWLIGPESIIKPTLAACTRIVFCTNSPLQEAVATGLEQARSRGFFETQVKEYQERRDVLLSVFDSVGLKYSLPEGTYFVLVVSNMHCGRCMMYVVSCYVDRIFPESTSRRITLSLSLCRAGEGTSSMCSPQSRSVLSHGCRRACWFIAMEIGVSSIPVSEVSPAT
jgi:kynurenine aminotransferase